MIQPAAPGTLVPGVGLANVLSWLCMGAAIRRTLEVVGPEPPERDGKGLGSTAGLRPRGRRLPLLDVKLLPPNVASHVIARPRLLERLGEDWKLGLIIGGPGTGKTVLAAQWFQTVTGGARAWVTLDNDDDRPERFWLYVASALERAMPGSFSRTVAVAIERADDNEALIGSLVAEAAAAATAITVVLEDLHATRDPVILAGIERLVEHLPSGLRVLITTRADPVLPLGRWRARSWLVEVRQRDLALTRSEAEALFAAMGEHRLDADEIDELRARTEGWAAALQLAILAMRDTADAVALARSFTGRHHLIADLLLSEVVERQSDEIREFMLCTSVADALDAELCDALSGRHDSSELLPRLEAQALFLVAIDDEGETFRYHQLLADLLRRELERRHPGRAAQLHRIAADRAPIAGRRRRCHPPPPGRRRSGAGLRPRLRLRVGPLGPRRRRGRHGVGRPLPDPLHRRDSITNAGAT